MRTPANADDETHCIVCIYLAVPLLYTALSKQSHFYEILSYISDQHSNTCLLNIHYEPATQTSINLHIIDSRVHCATCNVPTDIL